MAQTAKMAVIRPIAPTRATPVSNGVYRAVLVEIRPYRNSFEDRLIFNFQLQGEGVQGLVVSRSTSPNLSLKSKLADTLRGLLGRDLTDREIDDGIDTAMLVGTACHVVIQNRQNKNGKTYPDVEMVYL